MNDCLNAEMRDQLPDLLHERLDATVRAAVMAHVDGCADCRDELELLRVAQRALLDATPHVDLNFVIEAIPHVPSRAPTVSVSRRPVWADWRIAAAAVLLVAGGSSYSLVGRHGSIARDSLATGTPSIAESSSAPARGVGIAVAGTMARAESIVADASPVAEVSPDPSDGSGLGTSRLGDLNEQQLKALLTEIDQLQPTPITEPDPVAIRVDSKGTTSPEGL